MTKNTLLRNLEAHKNNMAILLEEGRLDFGSVDCVAWQFGEFLKSFNDETLIDDLVDCIFSYVNLVSTCSTFQKDCCTKTHKYAVFKFMSVLNTLNSITCLQNLLLQKIVPFVIDVLCDPSLTDVCGVEIMRFFNNVARSTDKLIRYRIGETLPFNVHKLADTLSVCGCFEYQTIILESIFLICSTEKIEELSKGMFPEVTSLQFAITGFDVKEFDRSARSFLNTLNKIYNNIVSVVVDKVYLEKQQVLGPVDSNDYRHQLWIDFNKNSITIFCDRESLRTVVSSQDSELVGFEVITIFYKDIVNTAQVRSNDANSQTVLFKFFIKNEIHVLFASSSNVRSSKILSLVCFDKTTINKMKNEILPLISQNVFQDHTQDSSGSSSLMLSDSLKYFVISRVNPSHGNSIPSNRQSEKSLHQLFEVRCHDDKQANSGKYISKTQAVPDSTVDDMFLNINMRCKSVTKMNNMPEFADKRVTPMLQLPFGRRKRGARSQTSSCALESIVESDECGSDGKSDKNKTSQNNIESSKTVYTLSTQKQQKPLENEKDIAMTFRSVSNQKDTSHILKPSINKVTDQESSQIIFKTKSITTNYKFALGDTSINHSKTTEVIKGNDVVRSTFMGDINNDQSDSSSTYCDTSSDGTIIDSPTEYNILRSIPATIQVHDDEIITVDDDEDEESQNVTEQRSISHQNDNWIKFEGDLKMSENATRNMPKQKNKTSNEPLETSDSIDDKKIHTGFFPNEVIVIDDDDSEDPQNNGNVISCKFRTQQKSDDGTDLEKKSDRYAYVIGKISHQPNQEKDSRKDVKEKIKNEALDGLDELKSETGSVTNDEEIRVLNKDIIKRSIKKGEDVINNDKVAKSGGNTNITSDVEHRQQKILDDVSKVPKKTNDIYKEDHQGKKLQQDLNRAEITELTTENELSTDLSILSEDHVRNKNEHMQDIKKSPVKICKSPKFMRKRTPSLEGNLEKTVEDENIMDFDVDAFEKLLNEQIKQDRLSTITSTPKSPTLKRNPKLAKKTSQTIEGHKSIGNNNQLISEKSQESVKDDMLEGVMNESLPKVPEIPALTEKVSNKGLENNIFQSNIEEYSQIEVTKKNEVPTKTIEEQEMPDIQDQHSSQRTAQKEMYNRDITSQDEEAALIKNKKIGVSKLAKSTKSSDIQQLDCDEERKSSTEMRQLPKKSETISKCKKGSNLKGVGRELVKEDNSERSVRKSSRTKNKPPKTAIAEEQVINIEEERESNAFNQEKIIINSPVIEEDLQHKVVYSDEIDDDIINPTPPSQKQISFTKIKKDKVAITTKYENEQENHKQIVEELEEKDEMEEISQLSGPSTVVLSQQNVQQEAAIKELDEYEVYLSDCAPQEPATRKPTHSTRKKLEIPVDAIKRALDPKYKMFLNYFECVEQQTEAIEKQKKIKCDEKVDYPQSEQPAKECIKPILRRKRKLYDPSAESELSISEKIPYNGMKRRTTSKESKPKNVRNKNKKAVDTFEKIVEVDEDNIVDEDQQESVSSRKHQKKMKTKRASNKTKKSEKKPSKPTISKAEEESESHVKNKDDESPTLKRSTVLEKKKTSQVVEEHESVSNNNQVMSKTSQETVKDNTAKMLEIPALMEKVSNKRLENDIPEVGEESGSYIKNKDDKRGGLFNGVTELETKVADLERPTKAIEKKTELKQIRNVDDETRPTSDGILETEVEKTMSKQTREMDEETNDMSGVVAEMNENVGRTAVAEDLGLKEADYDKKEEPTGMLKNVSDDSSDGVSEKIVVEALVHDVPIKYREEQMEEKNRPATVEAPQPMVQLREREQIKKTPQTVDEIIGVEDQIQSTSVQANVFKDEHQEQMSEKLSPERNKPVLDNVNEKQLSKTKQLDIDFLEESHEDSEQSISPIKKVRRKKKSMKSTDHTIRHGKVTKAKYQRASRSQKKQSPLSDTVGIDYSSVCENSVSEYLKKCERKMIHDRTFTSRVENVTMDYVARTSYRERGDTLMKLSPWRPHANKSSRVVVSPSKRKVRPLSSDSEDSLHYNVMPKRPKINVLQNITICKPPKSPKVVSLEDQETSAADVAATNESLISDIVKGINAMVTLTDKGIPQTTEWLTHRRMLGELKEVLKNYSDIC